MAAFCLLLIAPTASAIAIEVSTPPAQLVPDAAWSGTIQVTLDCAEMAASPGGQVSWTVDDGGAGFSIEGTGPISTSGADCIGPASTASYVFPINVTGGMGIHAERSQDITFTAHYAEQMADKTLEFEMQYDGAFEVSVPVALKQAGPQKPISYEVTLTSHANAPTQISWEGIDRGSGKWQLLIPDQVILGPAGSETATRSVVVVVVTPFENGANNDEETFTAIVRAASIEQGTAGDEHEVELVGRVKGFYVPGLGILGIPALVAVAAIRRR